MHKPGSKPAYFVVNGLQAWEKLLNTKTAESAAALDLGNVQGHFEGLDWGADWVEKGLKATRHRRPDLEDPEF